MACFFRTVLAVCAVCAVGTQGQLVSKQGADAPLAGAYPGRNPASLSPDCKEAMLKLNDEVNRKDAAKCEQANGYDDSVIDQLRQGEEGNAVAITEDTFLTCAKFTPECAGEVAPGVVQEVRFSGVIVTEQCRALVKKAQEDKEKLAKAQKCEEESQVSMKLLNALNVGDLDGAVGAAEMSLHKCLELSSDCAFQIAPILVNKVVTMAMMKQTGMMPVFVARNFDSITATPSPEERSLLAALQELVQPQPMRKARKDGAVLLQRRRGAPRVSRMVLELALK